MRTDDVTHLRQLAASLREHLQQMARMGVEGMPTRIDCECTSPDCAKCNPWIAKPGPDSYVICKGSVAFNNHCGKCSKCLKQLGKAVEPLHAISSDLGDCQRCGLCKTRTQIVFGEGPQDARIAIVGEAPGETEDRTGRPFAGEAGALLDKMLQTAESEAYKRWRDPAKDGIDFSARLKTSAGMFNRSNIRIVNTVSCRPPQNRKPDTEEIQACLPFLERQLAALPNLKCIITLGATPAFALLSSGDPDRWRTYSINGKSIPRLTDLRGKWFEWRGIPLMSTWHPAYLLRDPRHKGETWQDLQAVIERMGNEG